MGVAFYNNLEEGANLEVSIFLLKKKRASKANPSLSSQSLLFWFGRLWNWQKRKRVYKSRLLKVLERETVSLVKPQILCFQVASYSSLPCILEDIISLVKPVYTDDDIYINTKNEISCINMKWRCKAAA